jgi:hypothetical protein
MNDHNLEPGSIHWRQKSPSITQEVFLRRHGLWKNGLTRGQASELIGEAILQERKSPGHLARLEEKAKSQAAV